MTNLFQPLVGIGPVQHKQFPSIFEAHSDHLDGTCVKGGYKRFSLIGMPSFKPGVFQKLIDPHVNLMASTLGPERSAIAFEWHTSTPSLGFKMGVYSFWDEKYRSLAVGYQ